MFHNFSARRGRPRLRGSRYYRRHYRRFLCGWFARDCRSVHKDGVREIMNCRNVINLRSIVHRVFFCFFLNCNGNDAQALIIWRLCCHVVVVNGGTVPDAWVLCGAWATEHRPLCWAWRRLL